MKWILLVVQSVRNPEEIEKQNDCTGMLHSMACKLSASRLLSCNDPEGCRKFQHDHSGRTPEKRTSRDMRRIYNWNNKVRETRKQKLSIPSPKSRAQQKGMGYFNISRNIYCKSLGQWSKAVMSCSDELRNLSPSSKTKWTTTFK